MSGGIMDYTKNVQELSPEEILKRLRRNQNVFVSLEPGDATRYDLWLIPNPPGWGWDAGWVCVIKLYGLRRGYGITNIYNPGEWDFDESHLGEYNVDVIVKFLRELKNVGE